MLLLMLAGVASVVSAQPVCSQRKVRTGKVFASEPLAKGDQLFHAYNTTHVLRNFCKSNVVLYLGKKVFLSKDNFESSLPPLIIPKSMEVGVASVTSAFFASGTILLLVVNKNVYSYNYLTDKWSKAIGVSSPVSHVSGDTCCFNNQFCVGQGVFLFSLLALILGPSKFLSLALIPGTKCVSLALVSGFLLLFILSGRFNGTLGGIFYFHSMSQVGILEVKQDLGMFHYLEHPLNNSAGIPFQYKEYLDVIIKTGHRGFLVLWGQLSLLVSPNAGQIMDTVQLWKGQRRLTSDISSTGISIHSVASNTYELALLTKDNQLYYGSQGYLGTSVIQLSKMSLQIEDTSISFTDTGMLEILIMVADPQFPLFDFKKCIVNVQAVLMNPKFEMEQCNVELLESNMVNQMFTIDMNSKLDLSALMIPRPGKTPIPLVMVSNPHSLGFEAHITEFGNTFDGNYKYKLPRLICPEKLNSSNSITGASRTPISPPAPQVLSAAAHDCDLSSEKVGAVRSRVQSDPCKKGCLTPIGSTLISVGCDQTKKILVQNKISACSMGILNPVELQGNYTYIIEKEAYDPINHNARAQNDLLVYYQYKELGCPRLVYYDKPWKPVVEVWKNGILEEIMNAEYVITEINGIVTYSYSLTAATANCRSQPQNWSTFQTEVASIDQASIWNRENYVSCHEDNKNNPLLWPEVEYQILGGRTDNRVIFGQRNGIYTFLLSVVDPYYSYCSLDTMFSVYVYGALPMAMFPPVLTIMLLVMTTLLSIWLVYVIPKELNTERGQRFKNFCSVMFQSCLGICNSPELQGFRPRWLRPRRVRDESENTPNWANIRPEKPAVAPSVFVFQKDKGQKRSAGSSSPEAGEDSDHEDGNYCPPVKRERTSSLTHAGERQPLVPCMIPVYWHNGHTGGSGFRLKPPTLIHGQAPSAGLPSQKPREQQRGVLRPAVLQAPQPKVLSQTVPSSGTNGVSVPADCTGPATSASPENLTQKSPSEPPDGTNILEEKVLQKTPHGTSEEGHCEEEQVAPQAFVFGQNLRDRVKLMNENADVAGVDSAAYPSSETPTATNYFLQYISSGADNSTHSADTSNKFVFGQNMSERVLSPPKLNEASSDASRETTHTQSGSEPSSQEAAPKKESLAESAAAYTKATAWTCLLEKVEVITGEEAESNVLQIQCKLFVFDKTSQSWVERGRGLLRLNDMASTDDGTLQSRLVMRTQGSLRLILNTKLWAQMQMDKASEKSIRITATDAEDQGVKVFLISASSKDTGQLYAALHHRILALRSRAEQEQEAKAPAPEPGAPRATEEEDSDEDAVLTPSGVTGAGEQHGTCGRDSSSSGGCMLGLRNPLFPQAQVMKGMARHLGAHSSGAAEPGCCFVVCPMPVPPCRPHHGGVYCRGGRRLDPRVPSAADGDARMRLGTQTSSY
ncbi:transmembrane protein [Cricetulus griseus]|nr:transmembrane protein [Cricetulus griseus]